jgi:hypothetical protein
MRKLVRFFVKYVFIMATIFSLSSLGAAWDTHWQYWVPLVSLIAMYYMGLQDGEA